jgi:hypothetical protein
VSQKEYGYLALILAILTVVFIVCEILIWFNVLSLPQLGNLGYSLDQIFDNPAFVGLIATVFVGVFSGYMENWSVSGEGFDWNKFAETFYYYEPLLILFSQWLPMREAVTFTFALDILRRIAKRLRASPIITT